MSCRTSLHRWRLLADPSMTGFILPPWHGPPALVIFDCDGVLVDSEAVAALILSEYLEELGWSMTAQEAERRFRGASLPHCEQMIRDHLGTRVPTDFVPQLEARTAEGFERGLRPIDGVLGAVRMLRASGVPICVASNGSRAKMELTLSLTGLLSLFEGRLFSARDVPRPKPAPDIFVHAAREMGHPIDRTVVVEDSLPGIEAALEAGARVLAYTPRQSDRDAVDGSRVHTFGRMEKLPFLLGVAEDFGEGQGAC